jgi:glycerol-3-phosphate dehydrogenase subunit B
VITGSPVVGARTSGGRIEALVAGAAGHPVDYYAEAFVLATGGFNSGALELDSYGAVRDTVLDLPVSVPPGDRFAPQYFGTHAFARAGLAVDEQLHPLGGYENLYAAGATIAGAEPWREGSGEGIAISTGFAAAEAIVGAKQDALVA